MRDWQTEAEDSLSRIDSSIFSTNCFVLDVDFLGSMSLATGNGGALVLRGLLIFLFPDRNSGRKRKWKGGKMRNGKARKAMKAGRTAKDR